MKCKSDFVTNSSSSCFVVLVPHKPKPIDLKDIIKVVPPNICSGELNNKDIGGMLHYIHAKINECLETIALKCVTIYYEEYNESFYSGLSEKAKEFIYENLETSPFNILVEILDLNNYVLDSQYLNGEGNNMIIVLDQERVKTALENQNRFCNQ